MCQGDRKPQVGGIEQQNRRALAQPRGSQSQKWLLRNSLGLCELKHGNGPTSLFYARGIQIWFSSTICPQCSLMSVRAQTQLWGL